MKPLPRIQDLPTEFQATIEWLLRVEDYQLAKSLLERVLAHGPQDNPALMDYQAMVLYHGKFYHEAQEVAERTLKLIPGNVNASYNLARCQNASGRPDLAEQAMLPVLAANPQWPSAIIDMAVYVCSQGRFDEAYEMLLKAQQSLPAGHTEQEIVRFNLGWHLIRKGKFKEGMECLRIGRKLRIWGAYSNNLVKPVLEKHTNIQGKRVAIIGEGGAGDEIINARFAQVLKERGAIPMMVTGQKLEGILSNARDMAWAGNRKDLSNMEFDYWAPAMDMPQILDLDLHEIPSGAYLQASPEYLSKWRTMIPPNKKIKIGLRWQGNPLYERDLYRSVPFTEFKTFFGNPNFEFYSLQRDSGVEELDPGSPVKDLSAELKTWEDTAAAISCLDLVISSCTSIAHLAAALGKKTWVYTPINHYYIWASPGEKSAWYPDVTLFKQTTFKEWSDCTSQMKPLLEALAASGKSELVEV
ncbi:tetratricopeptide repeat protein [Bdellovibrio svalbardensis]|uniref:Tetratricopeptide repeat protein n=1 Tax=Bdellovibrio svalbardensis TaxID=2972972 RepID=A0ABT6DG13_9BACT|nr:tetratricopeptide repeat protein [Bdellovibrio svalbardensis]MDG0815790.1 tetratricopeptide repeat protein [Bdellovibrio svalbardensis]